jgi:hypothetical protein
MEREESVTTNTNTQLSHFHEAQSTPTLIEGHQAIEYRYVKDQIPSSPSPAEVTQPANPMEFHVGVTRSSASIGMCL